MSAIKCVMHKFVVHFKLCIVNSILYTEQCSLYTVMHMGVLYGRFTSKTLCSTRLTKRHVETGGMTVMNTTLPF